jgi:hypothetical protein
MHFIHSLGTALCLYSLRQQGLTFGGTVEVAYFSQFCNPYPRMGGFKKHKTLLYDLYF